MADKTQNLIPYKPGQSGNPKGRPKGIKDIPSIIRKSFKVKISMKDADGRTRKVRMDEIIVAAQIKAAAKGNTRAFNALVDRVEGKVVEKHELTGKDGQPLPAALPPLQVVVRGIPGVEEPHVQ